MVPAANLQQTRAEEYDAIDYVQIAPWEHRLTVVIDFVAGIAPIFNLTDCIFVFFYTCAYLFYNDLSHRLDVLIWVVAFLLELIKAS